MSDNAENAQPRPANIERIRALQGQIDDLKKRWPAHSTTPAMMQLLDDLEEELELELAAAARAKDG